MGVFKKKTPMFNEKKKLNMLNVGIFYSVRFDLPRKLIQIRSASFLNYDLCNLYTDITYITASIV